MPKRLGSSKCLTSCDRPGSVVAEHLDQLVRPLGVPGILLFGEFVRAEHLGDVLEDRELNRRVVDLVTVVLDRHVDSELDAAGQVFSADHLDLDVVGLPVDLLLELRCLFDVFHFRFSVV